MLLGGRDVCELPAGNRPLKALPWSSISVEVIHRAVLCCTACLPLILG